MPWTAAGKTHREIMTHKRESRANMAEMRENKKFYARSEAEFASTLTLRSGHARSRMKSQLSEHMRGLGIFGGANIMGGSTAVLAQPTSGAGIRRHMFGVMRETFINEPAVRVSAIELGKTRAKMSATSPMFSSWVKRLGYDKQTRTLYAMLGDVDKKQIPKDFYWSPVGELVFLIWKRGQGRCKTTENKPKKVKNYGSNLRRERLVKNKSGRYQEQGQPRWWRSKSPSLGATWWYTVGKQLVGKQV